MVNNTDYIFDAEKAIPRYGGVRDGTRLILYRWNGGKNQLWEIAPTAERAQHVRIVCQCNQDLSLAVRDGTAVLARTDHEEETQCWIQSFRNTGRVTDQEGHRPFALVNRATGEALRRPRATSRFKSSATARTRSTWRFCGRGATTLEKGSITSGASATSVLYWMRQRAGLNPEGRMTARLSSYSRPTLA
ncbi:ricin B-like lectin R40G3 isoform X1 [Brachypodium distachyon]|uniref:ricin B-like lectin R40G3 isoform X1 n=1 Tax=Brachypodium distachyon TaxID=15368 RepID=UPI000D0E0258|nr:ricin B-like lectin R40G3 isoform X1 [Brachypodium distachyon]XP_024313083.1 ricin B-like lectin R40G3 isoform X1 [Brachypodium distachyon]|eukprot:XP_024313082.1 ricin B-like lectin R40G3 isoform X1 [Brachypodium distachyon]